MVIDGSIHSMGTGCEDGTALSGDYLIMILCKKKQITEQGTWEFHCSLVLGFLHKVGYNLKDRPSSCANARKFSFFLEVIKISHYMLIFPKQMYTIKYQLLVWLLQFSFFFAPSMHPFYPVSDASGGYKNSTVQERENFQDQRKFYWLVQKTIESWVGVVHLKFKRKGVWVQM